MMQRWLSIALGAFFIANVLASPARALSYIRDAEIEHTLREYSAPIFRSANIPPDNVRIFIVNSPVINAFVAGGLNMFIHTGLIRATEDPGMLIGVIAHETGHIEGTHLAQLSQQSNTMAIGTLLTAALGAAAAVSGAGDAGAAIITAGQNATLRNMLSHYRGNEQAADQAALRYLDENDMSAQGMLKMFEVLRRESRGAKGDPYLRTHPLTTERIAHIRNHLNDSRIPKGQIPNQYNESHARMVAKLEAFMEPPTKTLARYPESNNSLSAHYARTIAWFRMPNFTRALEGVDALIAKRPNDPFFYDTKGQILFESGQVDAAIDAYTRAHELLPGNALILTDLGRAYGESRQPGSLDKAIKYLEEARQRDNSNASTWRYLATAYGKQGQFGKSHVALAEEAALLNEPESMLKNIERAQKHLAEYSPAWVRAEDLRALAKQMLRDKEDKKSLL